MCTLVSISSGTRPVGLHSGRGRLACQERSGNGLETLPSGLAGAHDFQRQLQPPHGGCMASESRAGSWVNLDPNS